MGWAFSSLMPPLNIPMKLRCRSIRTRTNLIRSFCSLSLLNPFNIKDKSKENKLRLRKLLRRDSMLREKKQRLQKNNFRQWLKAKRWRERWRERWKLKRP